MRLTTTSFWIKSGEGFATGSQKHTVEADGVRHSLLPEKKQACKKAIDHRVHSVNVHDDRHRAWNVNTQIEKKKKQSQTSSFDRDLRSTTTMHLMKKRQRASLWEFSMLGM